MFHISNYLCRKMILLVRFRNIVCKLPLVGAHLEVILCKIIIAVFL